MTIMVQKTTVTTVDLLERIAVNTRDIANKSNNTETLTNILNGVDELKQQAKRQLFLLILLVLLSILPDYRARTRQNITKLVNQFAEKLALSPDVRDEFISLCEECMSLGETVARQTETEGTSAGKGVTEEGPPKKGPSK
jgi:hypothetical protein